MRYTGIDYHKRYSVLCTVDAEGRRVHSAGVDQNEPAAFAAYFQRLPGPSRTVVEACWNWGWFYDLLHELAGVDRVVLSHPGKPRLIAEAQIKTDRRRAAGAVDRGERRHSLRKLIGLLSHLHKIQASILFVHDPDRCWRLVGRRLVFAPVVRPCPHCLPTSSTTVTLAIISSTSIDAFPQSDMPPSSSRCSRSGWQRK